MAGESDRYVVGIGASAGGIEAFRRFFEHMPARTGMTFIVVLHLPAGRTSFLPEILSRWTDMDVMQSTDQCVLRPDTVYLPPPGVVVTYKDGRLAHHSKPADFREMSPITILFNSLAEGLGNRAVGVVLSGTGNDGALGLKAIKEEGGLTVVQSTETDHHHHDGMPSSAIATGAVDLILPVEQIAERVVAMIRSGASEGDLPDIPARELEAPRRKICEIIRRQTGHDFSGYKENTFMRRVQRRIQLSGVQTLEAFIEKLESDRNEVILLFHDLLIGVTSFFRDEETFSNLGRSIIPSLFDAKGAGTTIRIWVAGCATGEEAYSLAILLQEQVEQRGAEAPKILVLATDIDENSIMTARAGRYPKTLLKGVSGERLDRYFVHGVDNTYTVAKSIREICTFSVHSLTRDPPFSRVDLVSCRNLLIYLDIELQSAVVPAFHYALRPGGYLLLGSSETINRNEDLFKPVDRKHRIFMKLDVPSPPLLIGTTEHAQGGSRPSSHQRTSPTRPIAWASTRILDRYAPSFAVVTADGTCLQYSSRIGRYLELPPGTPTQNICALARRELRRPLSAGLKEAVRDRKTVERSGILFFAQNGEARRLTLTIEPRIDPATDPLFLVVFSDHGSVGDLPNAELIDDVRHAGVDQFLEVELRSTREQLQEISEEYDLTVEELRSSNEELHSVNEELQSTNEELETSKEEIQSINEELQTVNSQLAGKVDELDRRNSDLKNLLDSTDIATIFLDPYLVIRSFTPAAAAIYHLIPGDVGRPLSHIVSTLAYDDLQNDCAEVLTRREAVERAVVGGRGDIHYLAKIVPYRLPNNQVDGLVITFVEVTSIVEAEHHQRLLVDELNHRVKNMLTVVISLAKQTIRQSGSIDDFADTYLGRIHALTAAYSLLSDESWQHVSLATLLSEELAPFRAAERDNVSLSGPEVRLTPRAALALGMAIHELTTNAVKYGALSVPEGNVAVTWHLVPVSDGEELVLRWTESEGPAVVPPSRRGFGTVLIERGLRQDMAADVQIRFASRGVEATVRAPTIAIVRQSAPGAGDSP